MTFLANLFTGTANSFLDAAMALVMVLLLILLVAWLVKFLANSRLQIGRPRNHRLAINDSINIDSKRKLILVRCDDREHLILIGGGQDVLIEADIALPEILQTAQVPIQRPTLAKAKTPEPESDTAEQNPARPAKKKRKKKALESLRATLGRTMRSLRGLPIDNTVPKLNPGTVDAPLIQTNVNGKPHVASETHQQAVERIGLNTASPKSVLARGLLNRNKPGTPPEKSDIARLQEDLVKNRQTMQFHRLTRQHPGMRTTPDIAADTSPQAAEKMSKHNGKRTDKGTDKNSDKHADKRSDTDKNTDKAANKSANKNADKIERDKKSSGAKKAPHNTDSDTVIQSPSDKSEKRANSGAKKAESRGKSK